MMRVTHCESEGDGRPQRTYCISERWTQVNVLSSALQREQLIV